MPLSPEQKKERRHDRKLLILSGILFGLTFSPIPFPFTLFFFLLPLLLVLEKKDKGWQIYKTFYLMLFAASFISVYWVGAFTVMRDSFLMISGGLLFFVNPFFMSVQVPLYIIVRKKLGELPALLLIPIFWSFNDLLYMYSDFSFPWTSVGHAAANFNSFIQIADVVGSLGVGLIVLYINVFLYLGIKEFRSGKGYINKYTIVTTLLIILPLLYGVMPRTEIIGKTVKVGIIQPNLDPYDKWAGNDLEGIMKDYFELSDSAIQQGAELLVWPETAVPSYIFSGAYPNEKDAIVSYIERNNVTLLTGMPDLEYFTTETAPPHSKYNEKMNYYYRTHNAAFLLQPGGKPMQRYAKMKLVPFGEKIPLSEDIPLIGKMLKWGVGLSGWNTGLDSSLLVATSQKFVGKEEKVDSLAITTLICYESVYPLHTAQFSAKGANMIAVLTNDSWYGNTSGPYQHRDFAKLRAIENRLPVIRAANGGISCLIDHRGNLHESLAMYTRGYLVVDVQLGDATTIFSRYPEALPRLMWITVIGAVLLSIIRRKRA